MIPSAYSCLLLACTAAAFFTAIGLPLARIVAPGGLAPLALAPALGWAAFSVLALPILTFAGFSATSVRLLCGTALATALLLLWRHRSARDLPLWPLALAAGVAVLPMLAILPKHADGGVLLGPPMFDHVKIAIVDAILRSGLPVQNPFTPHPAHLAYYYLWHFSAAMLASCFGAGGWAADAAMTGFTAFASLTLMMGLAFAMSGRASASAAVAVISLGGSMRPLLEAAVGREGADTLILRNADFGGWLNQAAWVPQHLASACCAVMAVPLMLGLAEGKSWLAALLLGLVVAAGFESSAWVGGVAFAAAGSAAGLLLLIRMPHGARGMFVLRAAFAAAAAAALTTPFIAAQATAVAARQSGAPLGFHPYAVFGAILPIGLGTALSLPAFWLLLLPFELPAVISLAAANLWSQRPAWRDIDRVLAIFALACLAVVWLFRSTIDNNDLGWRAMLPPILVMTPAAAALLSRLAGDRRWWLATAALACVACGLPDAAVMLRGYALGQRPADAAAFSRSQAAWDAVRRHSSPGERIANNPLFLATATPWPVNISWAAFSDRASCYAGWETVLAYGNLPKPRLEQVSARFERVFSGRARDGDVSALAHEDRCDVVLVTSADGAWPRDPFASGGDYRLVEADPSAWRIYRRVDSALPGIR